MYKPVRVNINNVNIVNKYNNLSSELSYAKKQIKQLNNLLNRTCVQGVCRYCSGNRIIKANSVPPVYDVVSDTFKCISDKINKHSESIMCFFCHWPLDI